MFDRIAKTCPQVREHLRDQFEDMVGKVNHFTQTKLEQLSNTLTSWSVNSSPRLPTHLTLLLRYCTDRRPGTWYKPHTVMVPSTNTGALSHVVRSHLVPTSGNDGTCIHSTNSGVECILKLVPTRGYDGTRGPSLGNLYKVPCAIVLCACYAMANTDTTHGGTRCSTRK